MNNITVSPDALDVLIDEPPELSKLYLCLVSNMDYKTYTVGITYRLNDSYFRERLSIAAVHGRKSFTPTRQKIRSVIARMIKLSLLSKKGTHVYHLPFEKSYFSLQKDYNHLTNQSATRDNTLVSSTYDGVKNIKTKLSNPHLSTTTTTSGFALSDQWLPSSEFAARVQTAGFDILQKDKGLFGYALVEMKMYWMSERPDQLYNNIGWERQLLKSMTFLRKQQRAEAKSEDKPHSDAKAQDAGGNAALGANNASSAKSKGSGLFIPKVPSYRNQPELERWYKSVKAPEPKPGEDTYKYFNRMVDWRQDKMRKAKYGNVH